MLIHIGYHKTGTSWLQERYFTSDNGYVQVLSHEEVSRLIDRIRWLEFQPEKIQKLVEGRMAEGKVPVISSEILSGSPFAGGASSYENLLKLNSAFPDAKILITIRNQVDYISSIYNQYIKTGGVLSVGDFLHYQSQSYSNTFWQYSHIRYSGLVNEYMSVFGKNSVLVVQYEEFDDKVSFDKNLNAFLGRSSQLNKLLDGGKKVNLSLGFLSVRILRLVNKFYRSFNNPSPLVDFRIGRAMIIKLLKALSVWDSKKPLVGFEDVPSEEVDLIRQDNSRLENLVGSLSEKYLKP